MVALGDTLRALTGYGQVSTNCRCRGEFGGLVLPVDYQSVNQLCFQTDYH